MTKRNKQGNLQDQCDEQNNQKTNTANYERNNLN